MRGYVYGRKVKHNTGVGRIAVDHRGAVRYKRVSVDSVINAVSPVDQFGRRIVSHGERLRRSTKRQKLSRRPSSAIDTCIHLIEVSHI